MNWTFLTFRSPAVWRQASTHSAALQNGRPGSVDVGHQLLGLLIAAVGVVALCQRKIGSSELPCGDRPDVDPEPLEQRHSIIRKQLLPCPQYEGVFHRNSADPLRLTKIN